MPIARIRNGELTLPITDEIREKLGVRDGDELDAHIFKGSLTFTPVSTGMRERAWAQIFSSIDRVSVRPDQPPMPIEEIERIIVDEVKSIRRLRR